MGDKSCGDPLPSPLRKRWAAGALPEREQAVHRQVEVCPVQSCPSSHALVKFQAAKAGYGCDACGSIQVSRADMFGCRECNFDLCGACASEVPPEQSCPAGHLLSKFQTRAARYECDGCVRSLTKGNVMYGCRPCNFDLCARCVADGVSSPCERSLPATGTPSGRSLPAAAVLSAKSLTAAAALSERSLSAAAEGICASPQRETLSSDRKERRLQEMLQEMDQQMLAICRRSSREATKESLTIKDHEDRRMVYTRMVHGAPKPVSIPETLQIELLPHQVEGLEWLMSLYCNGLGGILADEMGLGKTLQSIALMAALAEDGVPGPHLVLCPKSVAAHWHKELERALPDFAAGIVLYQGSNSEKKLFEVEIQSKLKTLKNKVVVITNFEQVHSQHAMSTQVLSKHKWELLIIDEGHRMKNSKTVFYQTMRTHFTQRMKLLLTGTPLQNNLDELFNLLSYILPEVFRCSTSFKAWFSSPLQKELGTDLDVDFTEQEQQLLLSTLHAMLAPFMLQRSKAEVLQARDLPPKREVNVWTELSAWQKQVYEQLKLKTFRCLDSGGEVSHEFLQNITMQLRKIALHPFLFGRAPPSATNSSTAKNPKSLMITQASGKLEALDRILQKLRGNGHRVLVFSQFTSMLDILQEFMDLRGWTWERIDGQVKSAERQARIERFSQKEGAFVFLLSARAGGLGLNLQAADTVVMFDMDWNPQNDKQAIARAHRIGQSRPVLVVKLLSLAPIEAHMLQATGQKLELERKLIGTGGFNRRVQALSPAEREAQLRSLLEGSQPGEGERQRMATTLQELNTLLARTVGPRA